MSKTFFIWIALSIFFGAAEIATESWFFVFFSAASILVALATFLGLVQPDIQVVLFIALGGLGFTLFRKRLITFLGGL